MHEYIIYYEPLQTVGAKKRDNYSACTYAANVQHYEWSCVRVEEKNNIKMQT